MLRKILIALLCATTLCATSTAAQDYEIANSYFGQGSLDELGSGVACLGKFNSSSATPDFIIGNPGRIGLGSYTVYRGADGSTVLLTEDGMPGSRLGRYMAAVSDVNQDGFDDAVISRTGLLSEKATLILGGVGPIELQGTSPTVLNSKFGRSITGIFSNLGGSPAFDIAIGAPDATTSAFETNAGLVSIFDGSGSPSTPLFVCEGKENDRMGEALAGLGDINNDNHGDIAVSVPGAATPNVRVYSGIGINSCTQIYNILAPSGSVAFGAALAAIEDLNADGVNELLISDPEFDNNKGRIFLHSGADGSLLCTINGKDNNDFFGAALNNAGDTNGDMRHDFVVGVPGFNSNAGQVQIHSYDAATSSCDLQFVINRPSTDITEFGSSISGPNAATDCDINNDQIPDFIIGSKDAGKGAAHVFVSKKSPPPPPGNPPTEAELEFKFNNKNGFKLTMTFDEDPDQLCLVGLYGKITVAGKAESPVTFLGSGPPSGLEEILEIEDIPVAAKKNAKRPVLHMIGLVQCGSNKFLTNVASRFANCSKEGDGLKIGPWLDALIERIDEETDLGLPEDEDEEVKIKRKKRNKRRRKRKQRRANRLARS